VCIATNGDPAMAVGKMGFSHFPKKKKKKKKSIVLYIRMHCADVMDIVAKIVNSVHARSVGEDFSEFTKTKMGLSTNTCFV